LGAAPVEQKKYADAEPLLLQGYEGILRHPGRLVCAPGAMAFLLYRGPRGSSGKTRAIGKEHPKDQ